MPKTFKSAIPSPSVGSDAPLVAIVGRPNVGKSTLFNRLTHSRRSIVGDEPGITRDRIYGEVEWNGKVLRLVDTGGIVPDDAELIPSEIYRQARTALADADLLLFVVDVRTELASPDYDLARLLLRSGKPVFLVVNKAESAMLEAAAENFRQLGIHELFAVSSEHGRGVGDLLEAVFDRLPAVTADRQEADEDSLDWTEEEDDLESAVLTGEASEARIDQHLEQSDFGAEEADESESADSEESDAAGEKTTHDDDAKEEISVAIIGRPNVGKSTLLNALTGTSRAIVSPIAGTTRDAVDEIIERDGRRLRLVDTAGIRRKGKTHLMAEKLSVIMSRRHLEACDVALLMIDATEGVTASDAHIGGYAHESGRSVIIVVNKWDLVTTARTDGKAPADKKIYEEQVRQTLKYLHYAPVIFISAAEGENLERVFRAIERIGRQRRKRISTGQMNRFLDRVDFQRATVPMAKRVRIFYITQAAVAPPTFVLFTDRQIKLHFAFQRFLENQIREAFGFEGTPIWFKVRARKA